VGFDTDETNAWYIFDNVMAALYWCDVLVNLISSYYDDDGKLVTTRR